MNIKKSGIPIFLFLFFFSFSSFSQDCSQPRVAAEFALLNNDICEGSIITIENTTNENNNENVMYIMDWGDGTKDTVMDKQNISHIYFFSDDEDCVNASSVAQDLRLDAIVPGCPSSSHWVGKPAFVTLLPRPAIEGETSLCFPETEIEFENGTCPDEDVTYEWDFGDPDSGAENTSEEKTPTHDFRIPGKYNVQLKATNICGESTTGTTVEIIDEPIANATFATEDGTDKLCAPLQLNAMNESEFFDRFEWSVRGPTTWTYTGGTNELSFDPQFRFQAPGKYTIRLDIFGCDDKFIDTTINIIDFPSVSLDTIPVSCEDILVNPSDLVTYGDAPIDNYQWTFTNQTPNSSTEAMPDLDLLYQDVGNYSIQIEASNNCGVARDTISFAIDIPRAVSIDAVAPVCNSDAPFVLQGEPTTGRWRGDGVNANGRFNPANAQLGLNEIIYQVGEGSCSFSDTTLIEVQGLTVEAGPDITLCAEDNALTLSANSPGNGGWSGPGIIDSLGGIFDPSVAGEGRHQIRYQVLDAASGCISWDERTVTVSSLPEAALADLNGGCVGAPIQFGSNSTGISSYEWDFGDNNTSSDANPSHTYTQSGDYILSLSVTTDAGCQDTISRMISIQEPVIARFEPDQTSGCADLTVNLDNNSSGDDASFSWFLSDSLISTEENPAPLLLSPFMRDSTYVVRLEVSSSCNSETVEKSIRVQAKPVASFGTSRPQYCSGQEVRFGNNSIADSVFWDFGNGNTFSGNRPPRQTFFTGTEYDTVGVTLYAFNQCGIDTLVKPVVIVPTDATAFISSSLPVGCSGAPISFESFSTPRAAPVSWDFGDGNSASGNLTTHIFETPGTYTVIGDVTACGFDSDTLTIQILPSPNLSLDVPDFVCTSDSARIELQTNVADHLISFGNGQTSRRNLVNFVYDSTATYQVTAQATSPEGCISTLTDTIVVLPLPDPLISLASDTVCVGEKVQLENTGDGNVECRWQFGDGNLSVGCAVEHTYLQAGTLDLVLTAIDDQGCQQSLSQPFFVQPLPQPAFTYTFQDSCQRGLIQFENNSLLAQAYNWDFGNGETSTQTNPFQRFEQAGRFRVTLEAVTAGGCSQQVSQNIEVYEKPTAGFTVPDTVGCVPFNLVFNNTSSSIANRSFWSFGEGTVAYDFNASHLYDVPGQYTVSLMVTTDQCADTTTQTITVHPELRLGSRTTDISCYGESTGSIDLEIRAGLPPFSFQWSNNALTEDQRDIPAGNYQVVVTDANGCVSEEQAILNQPAQPVSLDILENMAISCAGDSDGLLSVLAQGGTPDYTYQWSNGQSTTSIVNLPAGPYQISVTDAQNCESIFDLEVADKAPLTVNPQIRHISCFGENDGVIDLGITGGTLPYSAFLSGNGLSREGFRFDQLPPGDYNIAIFDAEECNTQLQIEIKEPQEITLNILQADTTIGLGYSLPLPLQHNQVNPSIDWSPAINLDLTDLEKPVASPTQDRQYVATLSNETGCFVTDTVNISVFADRNIFIPNAFSPDGDGHNDVFTVRNDRESRTVVQVNHMQIYDRWGELVFEQKDFPPNDYSYGWNGIFKGVLLQPDVYMYVVEIQYIDKDEPVYFQGDVRLFY